MREQWIIIKVFIFVAFTLSRQRRRKRRGCLAASRVAEKEEAEEVEGEAGEAGMICETLQKYMVISV